MSRIPKAPLTHEEVETAIKNRRADALPIQSIPTMFDLRSPAALNLISLCAALRREQIWRLREIIRKGKRPDIKSKNDERNFRPEVEAKRKQSRHERYHGNEEYRREVNRKGVEFFKANKERIYARIKARKPITQERDREYIRDWQRNKRRTDPQYNVGNRLRSRIWHAITGGNGKKALKTESLIGCTVAEVRAHIERQFKDGMNWERFMAGEIHIDHIRPCSSFDLSDPEQQLRCFHYTNLQPLWWRDNLSKSDNLPATNQVVG